ncbi:MBL fold metallo-hydrolase [Zhongshania aliphaticivorans]|uniref:MBL fold metallo-hydrolase n=1 Tax=Zhongshania aliphaticivorans TaxID=1470434 RepID=UPI0012E49968|nr:MBL fold metallo-hydrolase [Zhongshania aliphaticivorans]CAA0120583.1 Ribonuclease Z [Zhongshania aliphaticivorans]
MTTRSKFSIVLLLLIIAGAGFFWKFGDQLVLKLMQRQVENTLSNRFMDELPDGLHVYICGAGSPIPDPHRAGPCTAVIAGNNLYIVDAGSGSIRNIGPAGLSAGHTKAVLLTHFHSDHIDALGELSVQRWAGGHRDEPLNVYGPTGVKHVVDGFNLAYTQDTQYRIDHHGAHTVIPSGAGLKAHTFAEMGSMDSAVIIEDAGLRITAFTVDHYPIPNAVGYRFDYKGRSVVISGDTSKSANVEAMAAGADLLLHEALSPQLVNLMQAAAKEVGAKHMAQISEDILNYHTTPQQAADIAQAAGVKYLALNHIVPGLPLRYLEKLFIQGSAKHYKGPISITRDGDFFSLPVNSSDIHTDTLL